MEGGAGRIILIAMIAFFLIQILENTFFITGGVYLPNGGETQHKMFSVCICSSLKKFVEIKTVSLKHKALGRKYEVCSVLQVALFWPKAQTIPNEDD